MRRIVVIGGTGFFGGQIVEALRARGLQPLSASRHGGDLRFDVEKAKELRAHLKVRDVVIDAAGPYARRSLALIDAATRTGFDVIDLSDSSAYAKLVYSREAPIRAAGIRVLTSCSTLSTVSALVVRHSGVTGPRRLTVRLTPASRYTANKATATSMLAGIRGRARGGGLRCDGPDEVTLPALWPSLKQIEFVVDSGIPGMNLLLLTVPGLLARFQDAGIRMARRFGPKRGSLVYEIESADGSQRWSFTGEKNYLAAVLPAVVAARRIVEGRFEEKGLIPPDRHVEAPELLREIDAAGVAVQRDR